MPKACKRKDEQQINGASQPTTPKKPRLVFTDIQRRTLQSASPRPYYVRIRFLLRFSEAISYQLSVAKKAKSSQDRSSRYITRRKVAIFKETKRPSREMQLTISQQLQLDPTTVANFFMNARRRGHDRGRQEEEQQEQQQQQQQEQLQQSQTRQQEQQQQHQSEQQHDMVLNSNTNSETILGTIPPPPVFEQL
ncbi:unnamed protein product [Brugia pahangi]|uniref:Homeobox domain-containing protein n=1 Tax=Brugia pahangi TaxID=6280 RepID=A0A158PSQ9_BRUPA|nr:unnamed protein product [Brugia pahangi]